MKEALGLVEVRGLASAIHVADVMVKAANVHVIGLEKAKGNGWMTVKVSGDVGAVQAAVEAGAAEALTLQAFISQLVIPRPAEGMDLLLQSDSVMTTKNEAAKSALQKEAPDILNDKDIKSDIEKETLKSENPHVENPKPANEQTIAAGTTAEAVSTKSSPVITDTELTKKVQPVRKRGKSTKVVKTNK